MFGNRIDEKERGISKKTSTKNNPASKEFEDYITDKIKDHLLAEEYINRVTKSFSSLIDLLSQRYAHYNHQRKREGKELGFSDLQEELDKIKIFVDAIKNQTLNFSNAKICIHTEKRIIAILSHLKNSQWNKERKNGEKTRDNIENIQNKLIDTIHYFAQGDSITEHLYQKHLGGDISEESYLTILGQKNTSHSLWNTMLGSNLFYEGHINQQFCTILESMDYLQGYKGSKEFTSEKIQDLQTRITRFDNIFGTFKPNRTYSHLAGNFRKKHIKEGELRERFLKNFYENFCYCYLLAHIFCNNENKEITIDNNNYTISASDYFSDVYLHYDLYLTDTANPSKMIKMDFTILSENRDLFKDKIIKNNIRSEKGEKIVIISFSIYGDVLYQIKDTLAQHILYGKEIDLAFLENEKYWIKEHIESQIKEQLNTND